MPPHCNKVQTEVCTRGGHLVPGVFLSQHMSAARLCRAFSNLDHSLASTPAGSSGRAVRTSAKARAERPVSSRSRRRDHRPPLPTSPARPAELERRAERDKDSDSEEECEFDEEEEEEDDLPITEVKKEFKGSDRPPEPDTPPPGSSAGIPCQ